jgi:hypothetical protein
MIDVGEDGRIRRGILLERLSVRMAREQRDCDEQPTVEGSRRSHGVTNLVSVIGEGLYLKSILYAMLNPVELVRGCVLATRYVFK